MKNLLAVIAGALAIAWIAVPVAGAADVYGATHPNPYDSVGLRPAADVYGSTWSSLRPGNSSGWTSLRPHDVYQTSSWNRIHLRQTADVNERG